MNALSILFAIISSVGIIIRFIYANKARAERLGYSYHESLDNAMTFQHKALISSVVTFLILCIYWIIVYLLQQKSDVIILIFTVITLFLLIIDVFQYKEDESKYFRF